LLPQLVSVAQEHQASKDECQIRDEPQADGLEIAAKQEADFRRDQEGCTAKADDAKRGLQTALRPKSQRSMILRSFLQ